MENILAEILSLCKQSITDFTSRLAEALDAIEERRTNLCNASHTLYSEICDVIENYCNENGIGADTIDPEELILINA